MRVRLIGGPWAGEQLKVGCRSFFAFDGVEVRVAWEGNSVFLQARETGHSWTKPDPPDEYRAGDKPWTYIYAGEAMA